MDWEVTREPGEIAPSPAAGPCIGEELATMDAKAAFGPVDASRRTLGRKISHRKNPSETFAFAAGQLFQQTPEDFYNLLDAPLETSSKLQGFHHVVSEVRPVVSPYTSSGFALQQAASAEPESAASQHTLGEVKVRSQCILSARCYRTFRIRCYQITRQHINTCVLRVGCSLHAAAASLCTSYHSRSSPCHLVWLT